VDPVNKYNMDDIEIAFTLWRRLEEALKDENNLRALKRIVVNAEMLSAMMEANGILTEAEKSLYTLTTLNKKLGMGTHNRTVDNVLVFIFLKGLTTIPTRTKAYKLGLIDKEGRLIRKPKTKEEEDSISNLDLLMFKLRKWLQAKIQYLSTISWVKGTANDIRIQNYFSNTETPARQYMVKRINADLERLLSK
jgi:hypothetical protein